MFEQFLLFFRCFRVGDIGGDSKVAAGAAGESGDVVLQSHRAAGEGRRQQLQNGSGTTNSAELREAADQDRSVHLRGQRVEGFLLVGAAIEQRQRRIDPTRSEPAECHLRKRR